uniref:Uncharacterized protein n=1 Tax=Esox lucius TaxID=8010 RepID=A0A6Q2XLL2_ESOLU
MHHIIKIETGCPHTDDYMRFLDFMRIGESLDGLQDDSKTQGCEEHCVDQSPHHLSTDPPKGVFICRLCFLSEAHLRKHALVFPHWLFGICYILVGHFYSISHGGSDISTSLFGINSSKILTHFLGWCAHLILHTASCVISVR